METSSSQLSDSLVPFERVAKFIRQLTHDVRNGLSAIDLEAAFIAELVADPEAADEVRKLRVMVSNTAKMLKEVSLFFQPVTLHLMPWQAVTFFEELQTRLAKAFPDEINSINMSADLGSESIQIDLEQLINAAVHIVRNAFQFRRTSAPVNITAQCDGATVILEFAETKPANFVTQVPPEEWGSDPLLTTRPGGYGLGLFRVRQILEAHGAVLETHLQDDTLVTRMLLPVCTA